MRIISILILSLFFTIQLNAQVNANAGNDLNICVYDSLYKVGTGLNAGDTGAYQWTDLSNGSITYSQTLRKKNLSAGMRIYELKVIRLHNGNTYTNKDSFILIVNGLPIIKLNVPDTVCSAMAAFTLNSQIPAAGLGTWSGPGVIGKNFDPNSIQKTKLFNGPYTLKFVYTNPLTACTNSDSERIYVQSEAVVKITNKNPYQACENDTFHMTSTSSFHTSGTLWSTSGDGIFANNSKLNTDYFSGNQDTVTRDVVLTLTSNPEGVCPQVSDNIHLILEPFPVVKMPPHFVSCQPAFINFSTFVSRPVNASNLRYSWWFGNGDSLVNSSNGHPQNIRYTIPKPEFYDVRLKVTNQWGSLPSQSCSVFVDSIGYVRALPNPLANFSSNPRFYTTVNHPEFQFHDETTLPKGWNISGLQWHFNGLNTDDTSSLKDPKHLYPSDTGIYWVTLVPYYSYFDYNTNTTTTCFDSISQKRKVGYIDNNDLQIFTLIQNVKLSLELPFQGTLKVLDINGRVKETYHPNYLQQLIDISQWPAGVYLFVLDNGKDQKIKRFLKY